MSQNKYKFVNGVMVLNNPVGTVGPNSPSAPSLTVLSDPNDLMQASMAYNDYFNDGSGLVFPETVTKTLENTDSIIVDKLTELFSMYEVPIGLLYKLLELRNYDLYFILDDSGSMATKTNLVGPKDYTSPYMKERYTGVHTITRWNEQEDRIHMLVDFLAYVPTKSVTIRFLNRSNTIVFDKFKNPDVLRDIAHEQLNNSFLRGPSGGTPIKTIFEQALKFSDPTMIYLFTDGVPSDCTIPQIYDIMANRQTPLKYPITLVSCTDEDSDVEWMKEVESKGPYIAEVDDYVSEKNEVIEGQGFGFPYTKGLWIMCLLVACINPDDLDALDDPVIITKSSLGNILGRTLTEQEYYIYTNGHPSRTGTKKSRVS